MASIDESEGEVTPSAVGPIKVRLNLSSGEVEYEGPAAFFRNELPQWLEAFDRNEVKASAGSPAHGDASHAKHREPSHGHHTPVHGTTESIAAKLKCVSGGDLVLAACAQLAFVSGKSVFTRKEILEEMKKAPGYYKASYSGNLSNYLATLMKEDKLRQPRDDHFALEASTRDELTKRLA